MSRQQATPLRSDSRHNSSVPVDKDLTISRATGYIICETQDAVVDIVIQHIRTKRGDSAYGWPVRTEHYKIHAVPYAHYDLLATSGNRRHNPNESIKLIHNLQSSKTNSATSPVRSIRCDRHEMQRSSSKLPIIERRLLIAKQKQGEADAA
ncbi:hypothetical protein CKM354_000935300 [Cercospora kikuchii]|uniref:Uncharacterized protein n=1 Tax=Cercospora kikuchii TaxID=84275 RepID=A0A9P3FG43_9PEZI|nr:uncharacterized protein CKM354_000935300 [Cercospora kikuchii]GIZ46218.1 hypothetical protein CKM354_000935300 [Cercospora kikuchii]